MAPILYTTDLSPPCRAVYMTAKALNIDVEHKIIDFLNDAHLKDDFLKINPKHTIPTLTDGKLILTDSHAITSYLVTKYSNGNSLYPNTPEDKALIDNMLHFDSNVAFPALLNTCATLRLKLASQVTPDMIKKIENAYSFLDKFLEGKIWVATEKMTIADFHLITTVAATNLFVPVSSCYPNLLTWMKKFEDIDAFKETQFSLDDFRDLFKHVLKE
ncbi:glutathione S-transferase 1-like [Onthophagus taurus]|uniref:glutathione S-transferase 1-like n=1 Tax=Onthophagus taurus TaxID=166361 RepID=UPI0039BEC6FB